MEVLKYLKKKLKYKLSMAKGGKTFTDSMERVVF